jgi:hypothetical protein
LNSSRFFATNKVTYSVANGNSTAIGSVGLTAPTASGTATSRNIASTSLLASVRRIGYVLASASANLPTGWGLNGSLNTVWRGNAAGLGGFLFIGRFGFNAFTGGAGGNRAFVGVSSAAWTSGNPSAVTDMAGIGFDSADANFFVMTNDNSGTATRTDTGIAIAADKLYEVRVYCAPNDSKITLSLERIDDGAMFELESTADLPTNTTFLMANMRANSGASATTGAAIDIVGGYIESDN